MTESQEGELWLGGATRLFTQLSIFDKLFLVQSPLHCLFHPAQACHCDPSAEKVRQSGGMG